MSIATQLKATGYLSGNTSLRPKTVGSFSAIDSYVNVYEVVEGDLTADRTLTESRFKLDFTTLENRYADALEGITFPAGMSLVYVNGRYETRTLNAATNDGGGDYVLDWVFDGSQTITVASPTVTRVDSNFGLLAGGAGDTMTNVVDNNIAGLTGSSADKLLFSSINHSTASYTRNVDNWLALAGLYPTPYAAGNNTDSRSSVSLVAPNVGITANHFPVGVGWIVRFVAADNTVHSATVTSTFRIGSTDIRMVKFDTELPSSIGFFKVFPKNWADAFKAFEEINVPVIFGDQERKSLVADINAIASDFLIKTPAEPQRLAFDESVIPGDSSDPIFTNINGDWVFFTSFLGAGGGPFVSVTANYDAINSWMDANSDYQLTDVTL